MSYTDGLYVHSCIECICHVHTHTRTHTYLLSYPLLFSVVPFIFPAGPLMHFFVCNPNEFIRFAYKNMCVGFYRGLSALPSTSPLKKIHSHTPSNHIAVHNPQGAVGVSELLPPLQQCVISTDAVLSKSLADNHSCLGSGMPRPSFCSYNLAFLSAAL